MEIKQSGGMIKVVDWSELNWLYVLFNTMEEFVRASRIGGIVPSLATSFNWKDEKTLEVQLQHDVYFQNGEVYNAENALTSFLEEQRWLAPHPPGTWLNFPEGTRMEVLDSHTIQYHFPYPDGLALGKFRAQHQGNDLFWNELGFGYRKLGTGEGHW